MKKISVVLFDLDGTLLDTAEDLGSALNHLLIELKRPTLPQERIRPAAGRGCKGLLKLGLNMEESDARYPALSERLLELYQQYLLDTTRLFPGVDETLQFIEQQNLPWGIVTNKPALFTNQLIQHLNLHTRAGCVISGDTLPQRKPHPAPILHACKLLRSNPKECLYIGDSAVDISASKSAGGISLAALYGYIPHEENPLSWGAHGYIQHPTEIMNWIAT